MLGALNTHDKRITIVGAGIAGLVLAEALDRAGWEVTLLESAPRAGGLIETATTPLGPAESAAHSLLVTPAVQELCSRLGVELVPVNADSRARYIWRGGKLRRFPLSVWEAIRAVGRAYLALSRDPLPTTLDAWASRHLGEAARKFLLTPFVRGIYGARLSEIRVDLAFPSLVIPRGHSWASWLLRQWHLRLRGKLPRKRKGRARMMAPRHGMGALTTRLSEHLQKCLGARYRLGERVTELPRGPNVALCVPAAEAARLLEAPDPATSRALAAVPYTPLVSVTAFTEKLAYSEPPRGVGVLLPEGTSRRALGVLFNSSSFPERAQDPAWISLTVMLAGSGDPEILQSTDEQIQAIVRKDLETLFDLAPGSRIGSRIYRWPRAVPQYGDALAQAWTSARAGWCQEPGRVLFGNYTGQVSIRGMIETAAALR